MSTKRDHGYSCQERRCTNLLLLTHGLYRRFLKHPSPSMESATRLFGSPFRHFTGIKYEERPLRARASISLNLEGPLRCTRSL